MGAAEGPLGGPSLVSLSPSPSPPFASEPSQRGPSHGLPGPAAFLATIRWRGAHAGLYMACLGLHKAWSSAGACSGMKEMCFPLLLRNF